MAMKKPDPGMTKIFSENLKSLIGTNEELANKIDVSATAVADYINGHTIPRGDTLLKISQILNRSMEWLLTNREEEATMSTEAPWEMRLVIEGLQKQIDGLQKQLDIQHTGLSSLTEDKNIILKQLTDMNNRLHEYAATGDLSRLAGSLSGTG
jgi:transcriptional regulator with XRE-family HTH domain